MSYSKLYNSSDGAINSTFSPGMPFCLEEVRISLSTFSTAAANFQINLNSGYSTAGVYDTKLKTQSMTTATNGYSYLPTVPHRLTSSGDAIVVQYTNPSTRICGVEIVWRPSH
jgi:hypothetical protein